MQRRALRQHPGQQAAHHAASSALACARQARDEQLPGVPVGPGHGAASGTRAMDSRCRAAPLHAHPRRGWPLRSLLKSSSVADAKFQSPGLGWQACRSAVVSISARLLKRLLRRPPRPVTRAARAGVRARAAARATRPARSTQRRAPPRPGALPLACRTAWQCTAAAPSACSAASSTEHTSGISSLVACHAADSSRRTGGLPGMPGCSGNLLSGKLLCHFVLPPLFQLPLLASRWGSLLLAVLRVAAASVQTGCNALLLLLAGLATRECRLRHGASATSGARCGPDAATEARGARQHGGNAGARCARSALRARSQRSWARAVGRSAQPSRGSARSTVLTAAHNRPHGRRHAVQQPRRNCSAQRNVHARCRCGAPLTSTLRRKAPPCGSWGCRRTLAASCTLRRCCIRCSVRQPATLRTHAC
jgi:hypothetical protein